MGIEAQSYDSYDSYNVASKLQSYSCNPGIHKESKEPNIMMPLAEFLFFYRLNIFAYNVSVTRDDNAGMFNVYVHGKLVTRFTSQRHAIEAAIIKFNEASEGI